MVSSADAAHGRGAFGVAMAASVCANIGKLASIPKGVYPVGVALVAAGAAVVVVGVVVPALAVVAEDRKGSPGHRR